MIGHSDYMLPEYQYVATHGLPFKDGVVQPPVLPEGAGWRLTAAVMVSIHMVWYWERLVLSYELKNLLVEG